MKKKVKEIKNWVIDAFEDRKKTWTPMAGDDIWGGEEPFYLPTYDAEYINAHLHEIANSEEDILYSFGHYEEYKDEMRHNEKVAYVMQLKNENANYFSSLSEDDVYEFENFHWLHADEPADPLLSLRKIENDNYHIECEINSKFTKYILELQIEAGRMLGKKIIGMYDYDAFDREVWCSLSDDDAIWGGEKPIDYEGADTCQYFDMFPDRGYGYGTWEYLHLKKYMKHNEKVAFIRCVRHGSEQAVWDMKYNKWAQSFFSYKPPKFFDHGGGLDRFEAWCARRIENSLRRKGKKMLKKKESKKR